MKLFIFIMVYLRNAFSPIDVLANEQEIADKYSFMLFVRSGEENMQMKFSSDDLAKCITSKYASRRLEMYLLFPIRNSILFDELYVGYFGLTGKFVKAK